MSQYTLFKVTSITVDGVSLPIVDSSVRITGVAGFAATSVPSGQGPDYETFAREGRQIRGQIQFGPAVNPDDIKKIKNARIVCKDEHGPRRCLAPNCSFGSMGEVGGGPVDIAFNALEEYQWL